MRQWYESMTILREVMTRFEIGSWSKFTIRIWTEVPVGEPFDHGAHIENAMKAFGRVPSPNTINAVADALLEFDERVTAVEVLGVGGCGELRYRDWP